MRDRRFLPSRVVITTGGINIDEIIHSSFFAQHWKLRRLAPRKKGPFRYFTVQKHRTGAEKITYLATLVLSVYRFTTAERRVQYTALVRIFFPTHDRGGRQTCPTPLFRTSKNEASHVLPTKKREAFHNPDTLCIEFMCVHNREYMFG